MRTGWLLLAILLLTGCSGRPRLTGGGSSFVNPLLVRWATLYNRQSGVLVDYTSSASGDGIRSVLAGNNTFGCTDAPLDAEQLEEAGGPDAILHIPLVLGAVVPIYNLPGLPELKFTGPLLADIFLGRITHWNDPALARLNPEVELPDLEISVVYRADGSGTSYLFTDYLTRVSPAWRAEVGRASINPSWPRGQGEVLNPGVAQAVATTPGALGYVELTYARQNKGLLIGKVQNRGGRWVSATLDSITAAARDALVERPAPDDLRVSLADPPGRDGYPICGVVWAVCRREPPGEKGLLLADFLRWCILDGQAYATDLHYARLPADLARLTEKKIDCIR